MTTKADELNRYSNPGSLGVPVDWVPVAASAEALDRPFRAIRAENAGTVTVNMPGGNDRVLRFAAGETRYGIFTHVTAATATGLEGAI